MAAGDKPRRRCPRASVKSTPTVAFVERELAGWTLRRGAKLMMPLVCSVLVCGHDGEQHRGGRSTAVRGRRRSVRIRTGSDRGRSASYQECDGRGSELGEELVAMNLAAAVDGEVVRFGGSGGPW